MLVLFYFYELGYSPFEVASLFLFYEVFGIVTNLVGGFLAARRGLKFTLFAGLSVQVVALCMLGLAPEAWLVVPYVMAAQALSGIAKDLTKMSSKSAVKLVAPEGESSLYRWVAVLTGSKNALKGVGFFLGGVLLTLTSFGTAMLLLAAMVGGSSGPHRDPHARRPRRDGRHGSLSPHVLQRPGDQPARGSTGVPLRVPRRLVRRRAPRLPPDRARLELLGGGHLPRDLGHRLRHRAGAGAAVRRRAIRTPAGSSPTAATATYLAFVMAVFPAAIAIALGAGIDPTLVAGGRPHRLRGRLRRQQRGPLLPDPVLRARTTSWR